MKNETARIFAEAMRERRRALGITQRELAERISYSEKAISKWESAVALPPSSVLLPLSEALACGVEELLHRPEAVELYLGIDGGGTKTDFALAGSDGKIMRRVILGASNPSDVGMERTLECLSEGIGKVCEGFSVRRISVFAGLAGGSSAKNREAILAHLKKHGFARASCGSDADSTVEAGLFVDGEARDGVVVIMGTGSVTFMRKGGVKHRFGGYGYLLGDGGCGFSLGRDAICAALRDEEGTGEHTVLTDLIKARTGRARVLDSLADFYTDGKRGIASYAPLVLDAYGAQDNVAVRILADNVRYVAQSIGAAVEKMNTDGRVRVVIAGGLARRADLLLPMIEAALDCPSSAELSVMTDPPVKGALVLAGAGEVIFDGVNENG